MAINKNSKILISGGHLTPAQAVIDELRSQGFNNIIWVGQKSAKYEYKVITEKNIKFIPIIVGKTWRRWTRYSYWRGIIHICSIPIGFIHAKLILLKERPQIIVSFGGFVALPIVVSAWFFRIPTITHEQTIVSGLANKIIAKFAKKILVSWPSSLKHFPDNKVILTGNPLRQEVFTINTNKINFVDPLPILYITGGNQGANNINWRLEAIIEKLLGRFNIIHQTGNSPITKDFDRIHQQLQTLPPQLQRRYLIAENFFSNEIGEIFAKSDLIVGRAGANTVSEIIALNKYALFIPIPWSSGQEQQKNAEYAQNLGNGEILIQKEDLTPQELYDAILLAYEHSKSRLAKNAINKTGSQNASRLIVNEIIKFL